MKLAWNAIIFLLLGTASVWAGDWAGKYSVTRGEGRGQTSLEVEVFGGPGEWGLVGSADFTSGRSPAPDFGADFVSEKDGVLLLKFSDSFQNEGTMSLRKQGRDVAVHFDLTRVEEGTCLVHYVDKVLRRE